MSMCVTQGTRAQVLSSAGVRQNRLRACRVVVSLFRLVVCRRCSGFFEHGVGHCVCIVVCGVSIFSLGWSLCLSLSHCLTVSRALYVPPNSRLKTLCLCLPLFHQPLLAHSVSYFTSNNQSRILLPLAVVASLSTLHSHVKLTTDSPSLLSNLQPNHILQYTHNDQHHAQRIQNIFTNHQPE